MMKQYLEIKKDNPDSILFFRLGDFYEMFADDAKLASKELDLTLTSRDHGKNAKPEEERVPMCGIPYHASESYIARLIAKGYKVAICEQMEDPATAKGLVKRDIIRVVTPGTVIDAACLDDKSGNYLCGIYLDSQGGRRGLLRPLHRRDPPDRLRRQGCTDPHHQRAGSVQSRRGHSQRRGLQRTGADGGPYRQIPLPL